MSTLISKRSVDTITRLIRNEFDAIPDSVAHDQDLYNLILTANDWGLNDLVEEMINDLDHDYQADEVREQLNQSKAA